MALARPPPLDELSKELLSVDEEGCAEDEPDEVEDPAIEAVEDKVVEFVFFAADLSNLSFSAVNFNLSFSSRMASTRNRSCSASNFRLSS